MVVIPYATDIAEFINRKGSLPITSRRAFKRVLTTIKTIALIHHRNNAVRTIWEMSLRTIRIMPWRTSGRGFFQGNPRGGVSLYG